MINREIEENRMNYTKESVFDSHEMNGSWNDISHDRVNVIESCVDKIQ